MREVARVTRRRLPPPSLPSRCRRRAPAIRTHRTHPCRPLRSERNRRRCRTRRPLRICRPRRSTSPVPESNERRPNATSSPSRTRCRSGPTRGNPSRRCRSLPSRTRGGRPHSSEASPTSSSPSPSRTSRSCRRRRPARSPRRRLPRLQRLQRRPGLQPPLQIRSRFDRPRRPPNRPDRFRQSPTCRCRPCRRRSRRHRRRRGRCKAVPRTGPTRSVVEASREGAGTGAACQRTRIRGETARSSRARRRFGELERLPSLDGHLRDCLASLRRERLSTSPLGRRRRDAPAHGRASSRTGSRGTFPTEAHARSGLVPRLPSAAAAALRASAHVNRG